MPSEKKEPAEQTVPAPGAVRDIADLAAKAAGMEIVSLDLPAEALGLPRHIPVARRSGANPAIVGLADLAEAWRLKPARKKGTARTLTLASFVALANRHKTADSVLFGDTDWRRPSLTAVVDYHPADGSADNGEHRIAYQFPLSEEWQVWVGNNAKRMDQAEFAAFLEEHIADLSSPFDAEKVELERDFATTVATPAQLIQLSRGLQVHVGVQVKNAVTLQTGEGEIRWDESHSDADGKPLKVPGMFMLSIAPFFMGEKIRVPVRLRYRASGGSIAWHYQIYRPDRHVTERVRDDLDKAAAETGLPAYEGYPERPAAD